MIIHYNKSASEAESLAERINANNKDTAFVVTGDLDNTEDVQAIISSVNRISETIDLLVNNASAFYPTPIEEISNVHWEKLIGSNLKGPLFLIQGFKEKVQSSILQILILQKELLIIQYIRLLKQALNQ